ncbi:helix-turn-helix domain-containing protein [Streptosporangium sp. NPDC000396]|uniref:helix-turn-helix domain-containing protein n=1 Tax=Streptosporangium sp. NPDC000396 TaxID=3366185 RepID=UPI003691FB56
MKRKVTYSWRLREIMAAHGMFATTELVPLLAEREIKLSASQVHRLVTGTPERLSLQLLAALCDIFQTTPTDLVPVEAQNAGVRKTADGDVPPRHPPPIYGPDEPGSPPKGERETDLHPVPAVVLPRRLVARWARLPNLRRPRAAAARHLPRLRSVPSPARPAARRR